MAFGQIDDILMNVLKFLIYPNTLNINYFNKAGVYLDHQISATNSSVRR